MLEEGCFADPAFPDHGGALVGAGAEAVDDLADILAAPLDASGLRLTVANDLLKR
jgi:hypothetical protein